MKHLKIICGLAIACFVFSSCNKDVLDRPPLTQYVDQDGQFWRNEDDIRLFINGFYPNYFVGYNSGFAWDYAPQNGYTFNDDVTGKGKQANFDNNIPSSRGSSSEASATWLSNQYAGPNWNFAWVRKANILIDRLENVAKPNLSDEAYRHWMGVARFFRGYEYSRLVSVFGDVPYFGRVIAETELDTLYKDRDPRGYVMDRVYEDFAYAMANIRASDGNVQFVNKYIAAGFISRLMLFEGTFEHYHSLDAGRAKKYLQMVVDAGDLVLASNKWNFGSDFKALFASENLAGNPEVLLYRTYDQTAGVTHSIGSYSNGNEIVGVDPNLAYVKNFILSDGKVWQNSTVAGADDFSVANLAKTRDPRFEATFIDKVNFNSATLLYSYKFASRDAITFIGKTPPVQWGSNTNTSDAPVMRLGEIVLNWIEAKAVLAEYFGGPAVTQADLDKSINAMRNRPLDAAAITKGLKKTAPLKLELLPVDPARDADVPALIWEIRRERRMELVLEAARILDLKRWKKLTNMDYSKNPDYFLGPWVNLKVELPSVLSAANATKKNIRVKKLDGTIITWDGTNADAMVGFYMVENASNRDAFTDKNYMAAVGQAQINEYTNKGYTLTQTKGW